MNTVTINNFRICIIIPYFGKLPNYFQIWLNSCSYNDNIIWKLFTDDKSSYNYPANVLVKYESFLQFCSRIQNIFTFEVCIPSPYKLCDFKPAYGEIFENELQEYHYWGFCDLDMIFGDFYNVIKPVLNLNYDKIFTRGHLTLIKNNHELNRLYRIDKFYINVFTSKESFAFDEWSNNGINSIFLKEKKSIYDEILFSDIFIGLHGLYPVQLIMKKKIKQNSIFHWKSGKLIRLYYQNSKLYECNVIYVHLQKRKMSINNFDFCSENYFIQSNKFISTTNSINYENLHKRFSKKIIYWPYVIDRIRNLFNKFKKLITRY